LALPKPKTRVVLIFFFFFFPMTPGEHPLGIFSLVDKKEFDFCCKLSNFLLLLKGVRGKGEGGFIAHTESLSTMCK
jgi:hypothetical protein